MTGELYNERYTIYGSLEQLSPWHKELLAAMLLLNIKKKKKKIIDIGCGECAFIDKLREMGGIVEGIEISEKAIKICQERGIKAHNINFVRDNLPWNDHFDIAVSTEVIEHIFDHIAFIARINYILKHNGIFGITTPNFLYYKWIPHYIKGKSPSELQNPSHIRFFTKKSLQTLLEMQGFDVLYTGYPFRRKYIHKLPIRIKRKLEIFSPRVVAIAIKKRNPRYDNIRQVYSNYHTSFKRKLQKKTNDDT